jgi:hypothetical protein
MPNRIWDGHKYITNRCPTLPNSQDTYLIMTVPHLSQDLRQSLHEVVAIGAASEYISFFNPANHDVVQRTSSVYSRSPWHHPPIQSVQG